MPISLTGKAFSQECQGYDRPGIADTTPSSFLAILPAFGQAVGRTLGQTPFYHVRFHSAGKTVITPLGGVFWHRWSKHPPNARLGQSALPVARQIPQRVLR
jgi:hypothetical protein